jgi:uncharacterized protein YhaN
VEGRHILKSIINLREGKMKKNYRKVLSLILAAACVFSMNLSVLADESAGNGGQDAQASVIRNWKKEFLEHASLVFDEKRDENIRDKLDETRKEKDAYARKVGQLTMQVDWLKKKSEEVAGPDWESKFTKKPFDF